jgi:hypothetical protein
MGGCLPQPAAQEFVVLLSLISSCLSYRDHYVLRLRWPYLSRGSCLYVERRPVSNGVRLGWAVLVLTASRNVLERTLSSRADVGGTANVGQRPWPPLVRKASGEHGFSVRRHALCSASAGAASRCRMHGHRRWALVRELMAAEEVEALVCYGEHEC